MTSQLRIYRMKPGAMDEFVALWRDHVVPARLVHGFTVTGAWTNRDADEFVWIVSYDGPDTFEQVDARYYDSPERVNLPTSPAEYIDAMELRMLDPVAR
jgi:antibiotic biosynthesis monooxygenase (ABM) superfamily enzyme